ncbi:hypothetical protein HT585_07885 [Ensifer sp. HO-A22]|uniref:Uncharacterized protein n=1 Tax=Ensifer oleiphilus TaxID=2742698 RepID=A0A7Y6Q483_9HYPH|nr:hypothetical protein [Ensifer oleiphilus]NVD38769.1 hypothetical protein [Ensifer oleiphilus]
MQRHAGKHGDDEKHRRPHPERKRRKGRIGAKANLAPTDAEDLRTDDEAAVDHAVLWQMKGIIIPLMLDTRALATIRIAAENPISRSPACALHYSFIFFHFFAPSRQKI